MFNLKSAWAGLCSAVFICNLSYAAEIGHVPISLDNALTHSHTTHGLEPIQASYQIAKLQFLPDLKDSETGWAGNKIGGTYNKNDCSAYPLKSCPTGAKCSKCPFAKKYKINSCSAPFILSEGACVCPAVVALVYPNDVCTAYCSPRAGTTRRCIKKSCTPSPDQTGCTRGTQACDDGCGKNTRKCCNACVSRAISKPANSHFINYTSCIDGDGTHDTPGGWACDSGYHKSADGKSCIKDCNVTNCASYTLPSCPPNGNCSDCTKTAANCSTDGTMYKLDSCKDGYVKSDDSCVKCPSGQTLVDGTCVECASSLTARRSSNGYTYTAKKLSYNGIDYAVATASGGAPWTNIRNLCKDIGYSLPDYNFAKHIIANINVNAGNDSPVLTSTQCGSSSYLGCTNKTTCPCFEEAKTGATNFVCVKPLCSANVTAETCPSGYSLNACGYGETAVSTTTGSQGSTCYKCSCATGYNSLTFRSAKGSVVTATKVTYNGETYAVVNHPEYHGITCNIVKNACEETDGYSVPSGEFAQYLLANKSNYGLSLDWVCTSQYCGGAYVARDSKGSSSCSSSLATTFATCVKKVCAGAVEETCPSGYQLSKCFSSQKQTGTTSSSLGNTCYKCETDSSSSGSSGSSGSGSSSTCTGHKECCALGFSTGKKCYLPNYNCAASGTCTSTSVQQQYANCIRTLGNGYYCCSECPGAEVN